MAETLLEVKDLKVHFNTPDGVVKAVDGVSFTLERGETLGIVGESGSGKSVTCLTALRLINLETAEVSGQVLFKGRDLLKLSNEELRKIRGKELSMIFQDPFACLHPLYRVGAQIDEAVRAHGDFSKADAKKRTLELLKAVGIPRPEERYRDYPHQYSGGMRQRAMIAMALVHNPDVLIADEPTTALDVTVQAQILELIEKVKEDFNIGVMLITHDLGVVADVSQKVMVMYAGRPVEIGTRDEVFAQPLHPYTWGLLDSIPAVDQKGKRLIPITGSPPSMIRVPQGCAFHPRCPHRFEPCDKERPDLMDRGGGHPEACHLTVEEKKKLWAQREASRTRAAS
ncbi:MAG: peptide/nickel transport system ATP-binding protein [Actinomycetota bacterium]|jgi:peptide/nickel transport system ATP-binding protein|nr:peptide/nickel transport system ATP-binding protein [Actinomycetota bacterium]